GYRRKAGNLMGGGGVTGTAGRQGSPRIGSDAGVPADRERSERSVGELSDRWGWLSAHVAYHDTAGQDGLLLHAVRPLVTRLRGEGVPAFFLRHWRCGPHLRLNVRTGPEAFTALVRPGLDEVVGGYLRAHPSAARPDPEALLPMHRRLAEAEGEDGPLLP